MFVLPSSVKEKADKKELESLGCFKTDTWCLKYYLAGGRKSMGGYQTKYVAVYKEDM